MKCKAKGINDNAFMNTMKHDIPAFLLNHNVMFVTP